MDPEQGPKVYKWLWITLIAVVLIGAGFFSWYYIIGHGKKVVATATTTTPTATSDQLLAGYTKYSNDTYGFSFQYPKAWASTKLEVTSDSFTKTLDKDLVFKVTFYDPNSPQAQTYGPVAPDGIYFRVYKKPSNFTSLSGWLYSTFHLADTDFENYKVGSVITLGGQKGYYSSSGCCGVVDRNYVVEKGGYIYSLGSNHFDTSITDKNMPATFQKILPTVQFTQ